MSLKPPSAHEAHVRCCVCGRPCHTILNVAKAVAREPGGAAPAHVAVLVRAGHWLCAICTGVAVGSFAAEIRKGRKAGSGRPTPGPKTA